MMAFLDFEASSLGKQSYPIEVAWVFEDGSAEAWLIRPAPGWTDWGDTAAAIHGIARSLLETEGVSHDAVARRMIEALSGHDLLASAPSWDGKWLSTLLRAAGLPRHSLRLRDSDDAHKEAAVAILAPVVPAARLPAIVADLLASTRERASGEAPAHRALADAQEERQRWLTVRQAAHQLAAGYSCG
jgi:hypothetical protein